MANLRELNGIWVLGRRDPGDYYSQQDIGLLQSVANQTAIALSNIAQAERLRALYQNDIDQSEAERASLARELDDNALNRLGALKNALPETLVLLTFEARYNTLADSLRQTITGLHLALTDLVDSLNSPGDTNGPEIILALAEGGEAVRHDAQVELHVYRIVQQACDNALTHSRARCVTIRGHIEAGSIDLTVEDDGVGFEAEGRLDLSRLTAHQHFGLAGMFERANIIRGKLHVDSAPGRGTRIRVTWNSSSR